MNKVLNWRMSMKLIFATTNIEKFNEAKLALAPYGYEVEHESFDFNEPINGEMENIAKIKLMQVKNKLGLDAPVFVDDSGIYFEAYNNFPGILTKRIFRMIGYRGIKKLLENENRKAHFHGVIAFIWNNEVKIFHGRTYGSIIKDIPDNLPDNLKFPFDPIFIPKGSTRTFGQMDIKEKLNYSYRREALDGLGLWLNENIKISTD